MRCRSSRAASGAQTPRARSKLALRGRLVGRMDVRRRLALVGESRRDVERFAHADRSAMAAEEPLRRAAAFCVQPLDPRARAIERRALREKLRAWRPDPV